MLPAAPPDAPELENVRPESWRSRCTELVRDGGRVAALYAAGEGGGRKLRAVIVTGGGVRVVSAAAARPVDSLVGIAPAVGWDEREAHDLYGLGFTGHAPLRPLVRHAEDLPEWTVPAEGADIHQVAVGPIHAGVIESGHFRFHVVGERILHLDVRLFHKHRGLECAAEGLSPDDALPVVARSCAACWVANSVAYAQACESALGLWPEEELARTRTILLELERLYNHLHDLGAVCAGVGFAPGAMAFAALKERSQRLNHRLFGHRFLFATVAVALSRVTLSAESVVEARAQLRVLREHAATVWHEMLTNSSVQDRLEGIGIIDRAAAGRLGAVGPTLRAAGIAEDVRQASPRLRYQGFEPGLPPRPGGDVAARIEVRAVEIEATFDLLEALLDGPLRQAAASTQARAGGFGVSRVESPRGETVCVVELAHGLVRRVHLRTGSYANWPAVALAAAGNLLPDFPLINKSFELCYACADR